MTAGVYTWNGNGAFEKYDIDSIEVSASGQTENFSVAKGGTLQFAAKVKGADGTEVDAALRDVEWALWGATYASRTTISDTGLLTVAQDETKTVVYVIARSVKNPALIKIIGVSVTDGGGAAHTGTATAEPFRLTTATPLPSQTPPPASSPFLRTQRLR